MATYRRIWHEVVEILDSEIKGRKGRNPHYYYNTNCKSQIIIFSWNNHSDQCFGVAVMKTVSLFQCTRFSPHDRLDIFICYEVLYCSENYGKLRNVNFKRQSNIGCHYSVLLDLMSLQCCIGHDVIAVSYRTWCNGNILKDVSLQHPIGYDVIATSYRTKCHCNIL